MAEEFADGNRLTCFATNTKGSQLADLELRHRTRARCEDRIRSARSTGLRNLPLHDTAQNRIWLEIVSLRQAQCRVGNSWSLALWPDTDFTQIFRLLN